MAEPKSPDLVKAYDAQGNRVLVSASKVKELEDLGGRAATAEETARAKLDAQYEKASTLEKATGIAVDIAGGSLGAATGIGARPAQVDAFHRGAAQGLTGGLYEGAVRQARDAVSPGTGAAYEERTKDIETAYSGTKTVGEVAGFVGGLAAGPLKGVSAAGAAAEGVGGRLLAGVATKGVLGRAAATGGALGLRGAAEGALLGASQQIGQDLLEDHEITGEKLFAAAGHGALGGALVGTALGAGGSLLASAGRGVVGSARGALASAADRAGVGAAVQAAEEEAGAAGARAAPAAAGEAVPGLGRPGVGLSMADVATSRAPADLASGAIRTGDAATLAAGEAEARAAFATRVKPAATLADDAAGATTGKAGSTERAAKDALSPSTDPVRAMANERAWNAMGGGFGLQSTSYAKKAAKYFPNGTSDLGEIGLRYGIIDTGATTGKSVAAAALDAVKGGRPADMLPQARTALEGVGTEIGNITEASGARISGAQIFDAVDSVAKAGEVSAASRPAARAVRAFGAELLDSLGVRGPGSMVRVQDLLRERKALDQAIYEARKTLVGDPALEAKRVLRARLEGVITDAMDEASGKMPGDLAGRYKTLKKDYHGLSLINETLEDSAARASKGATLGLGEKIGLATSLAGGHFLAGPVLALGGKVVKERGSAAAAVLLSRAADAGTFSRLVRSVDEQIGKSAAGVFREGGARGSAASGGGRLPSGGRAQAAATQKEGQKIVEQVSKVRANPERFHQDLQDAAELVGQRAGPKASSSYTSAALRAFTYLASYIPSKERRDPLDPRSIPPLTYDEADRLTRAAGYASDPPSVWKDFERGKITPEGIRAAKELMPETYSEFQRQLYARATEQMMHGKRPSDAQRLRLDKLLGIPAGADLRPETLARLQGNFEKPLPEEGTPANAPSAPTGNAPIAMKIQQSGFDAIEVRKTG